MRLLIYLYIIVIMFTADFIKNIFISKYSHIHPSSPSPHIRTTFTHPPYQHSTGSHLLRSHLLRSPACSHSSPTSLHHFDSHYRSIPFPHPSMHAHAHTHTHTHTHNQYISIHINTYQYISIHINTQMHARVRTFPFAMTPTIYIHRQKPLHYI